ncbi:sensor histidine kinase [Paenibacillus naphthalenovorans]|uniref:sensor histidine kinase n=1 Tax=Paenibacillus naphthalenovorans TaxID=162209 RepID=UPI00088DAA4F|nr:histidine kinase [Paenibacillus naphthalenovorans]SDI32913.1 two-component system, sensor histidine kinase YesM [Paenibacillus naphthalenovorans]
MNIKMNTFGKVITLVFSLLIPIILLYGYSHQVSMNVVRETVEDGNRNRLSFFMSQMELMIEQFTKYSVIASRDYSIKEYLEGRSTGKPLDQVQRKMRIVEMLNMQIATSGWNNQIILHLSDSKEVISTDYSVEYNQDYIDQTELKKWLHRDTVVFGAKQMFFSRMRESDNPNLLIEVRFTDDNLKNMLNQLKQGGRSEPFFYLAGKEPILNRTADHTLVSSAVEQLDRLKLGKSGNLTISLNEQQYIVNYIRSESLGWYLVDLVPLESIYSPITVSRNLFYTSVGLLMVLSILMTLLLYRNVQRPIQLLLRGVQRIKDGQYSVRLQKQPNNEFDFLFNSFNQMAEQIQELIEKVYKETLRSREATLKQLQSQINPHFLYNCLFYIKNMASLGEKEAVVAMSLNLGEYYRYTTRLENPMTTIREEMKLIQNYLEIQTMRMQRLGYEIAIPEDMMELEIPRLLIQPIVENAVIHGVENQLEFGIIHIKGERSNGTNRIIVDDNGGGMSKEAMTELQTKINVPMDEQTGCGLWNIHQRLIHMYEGKSGLFFSPSPLNGLRVEVIWETAGGSKKGGDGDVPITDRR